jgi:hypothetical protein
MADEPTVSEVVDMFERVLRSPDIARNAHHGVLGTLLALHQNNIEQWKCEDIARRDGAGDHAIAAAKREIDALNTKRHELVEAIDAALLARIDQAPSAPPATESPAMVFDRMSVLTIRVAFTERVANSESHDRNAFAQRLPLLYGQLGLLREALEVLFDDVQAGRKRFVPYQSLKLYRAASASPLSHGDGSHRD